MTMHADHISLTIGKKQILNDVCFTARPGEVSAIVGPNGSGKSTLLKAMVGELPCDGKLTLNGRSLQGYKPWELSSLRGVLPQATTLAFPFTVLEVVRLGLAAGVFERSFVFTRRPVSEEARRCLTLVLTHMRQEPVPHRRAFRLGVGADGRCL